MKLTGTAGLDRAAMVFDGFGHIGQGDDLLDAAEADRFLGHAVNHATGFVLGEGDGTGFAQAKHSGCAVGTHAGEKSGHAMGCGADLFS